MTKDQAEKIYEMHKELVSYALIEFGTTDRFASTEKMSRWRRKEIVFKRYLESLIGDYIVKEEALCKKRNKLTSD